MYICAPVNMLRVSYLTLDNVNKLSIATVPILITVPICVTINIMSEIQCI